MRMMEEVDMANRRVLIRLDLNVPMHQGIIDSSIRIDKALPTIKLALKTASNVVIMSHLGRPKEGTFDQKYSLDPVAKYLAQKLDTNVSLCRNISDLASLHSKLILLENVRFNKGESENCEQLSKRYAAMCDIFVMDAFATAHRAQASTYGVAKYAATSGMGPRLKREVEFLNFCFSSPKKPVVAIVGGSKVSSKLGVLENLANRVDSLIVGGGIANTFLVAANKDVGKSLYEKQLVDRARAIMDKVEVILPSDVVVSPEISDKSVALKKLVDDIGPDEMVLDIGISSSERVSKILEASGTIIWNGPVGVFEIEQFSEGTKSVSAAVSESGAFSIAGGGDTLAAIEKYKISKNISYISTGGGAFLKFLENGRLPAIDILNQ